MKVLVYNVWTVLLNEGASSSKDSLLECEEIVESDHKGRMNE